MSGAASDGFLVHLNPLAKVAAVVPAWLALAVSRELLGPLLLAALALLLLVGGARLAARTLATVLVGLPLAVAVVGLGFSVWADPSRTAGTPVVFTVGAFPLTTGALVIGLTTALRIGAFVALGLVGGLTTSGPDFARALTAQLRVPYRFSYAAVAAYRFVPRTVAELRQLRQAQRVRGVASGGSPVAVMRGASAAVVPLLAASIRHADRVALAMESRAFGAHPTRTERRPSRWRPRDTAFVLAGWVVTAAVLVLAALARG